MNIQNQMDGATQRGFAAHDGAFNRLPFDRIIRHIEPQRGPARLSRFHKLDDVQRITLALRFHRKIRTVVKPLRCGKSSHIALFHPFHKRKAPDSRIVKAHLA